MSGREPVAAFFPSIDRNLMAELDRHLRAPSVTSDVPQTNVPAPAVSTGRPDIEGVVEAVEQAASSLVAMTARIHELEAHVATFDVANRELRAQLGVSVQRHEASEAKALAHQAHADESQRVATHHASRADKLERDLETALADLNRITDAIANALGLPPTI